MKRLLPAAWICGVVREQKIAVIIDDCAARGRAAGEGKAVRVIVAWDIYTGNQFFDCPEYVILPAESAYKALLGLRIALLLGKGAISAGAFGCVGQQRGPFQLP